jgi:carboxymethylenebutenolidase
MCHETTARPPLPPIAGGAATGESITLQASDGNEFAAFAATAEGGSKVGMVVLPDVRGLHAFYEDLALRFAEQGIHSVAFDYFGRTAGVGRRDDDFDFWPEVMKTTPETIAMDVAASVAKLRDMGAEKIFTVGFCFGGRNSFDQATRGHGLSGVVGFYGTVAPRNEEDTQAPLNKAARFECPVLGLFGGADQMIAADGIEAFGKALTAAGVANEMKIYDGAPHSFFDRSFAEHAAACDDAWTPRILSFIETNS